MHGVHWHAAAGSTGRLPCLNPGIACIGRRPRGLLRRPVPVLLARARVLLPALVPPCLLHTACWWPLQIGVLSVRRRWCRVLVLPGCIWSIAWLAVLQSRPLAILPVVAACLMAAAGAQAGGRPARLVCALVQLVLLGVPLLGLLLLGLLGVVRPLQGLLVLLGPLMLLPVSWVLCAGVVCLASCRQLLHATLLWVAISRAPGVDSSVAPAPKGPGHRLVHAVALPLLVRWGPVGGPALPCASSCPARAKCVAKGAAVLLLACCCHCRGRCGHKFTCWHGWRWHTLRRCRCWCHCCRWHCSARIWAE